jgi:hypothetical protein
MATDDKKIPATLDALFPGRFLKAESFGERKVQVTITDVYREEVDGEKDGKPVKENKAIVCFKETERQLAGNKLNAQCLRAMFGDPPNWIGKKVTLYATNAIMPMPRKRGDDRPPEACVRVWGSADIARDIAFVFEPPKRRPIPITLHCTRTTREPVAPPSTPPPATDTTASDSAPATDKGFDEA